MPDTFAGDAGAITVTTREGKRQVLAQESDRFQLEIEDFSDAVINGRPPRVALEDTLRDMEIIDELLAMRTGAGGTRP